MVYDARARVERKKEMRPAGQGRRSGGELVVSPLDETLSVTSRLASSVRRYRIPSARPASREVILLERASLFLGAQLE